MEASKQFGKLVELIADLQINGSKVHLVLIGDGPERPALEKLAAELGILASVTFPGEVPLAKQWLPAFDLFVFTSVDEGMPNAVLEAGAAGLPIVTWELPFYREILENEKTGLLVEAGNIQKLEEAITRLIDSPPLRARLGAEAQAHVLREFSLERFITGMSSAYQAVLRGDKPSGEFAP